MSVSRTTLCEALVLSPAAVSTPPGQALRVAFDVVDGLGGELPVAAAFAGEYGEHPELTAGRMRWARGLVDVALDTTAPATSGVILASALLLLSAAVAAAGPGSGSITACPSCGCSGAACLAGCGCPCGSCGCALAVTGGAA